MTRNSMALMLFGIHLGLTGAAKSQKVAPPALETWADPGLKVTRGLALWLDAGRLGAACRAQGHPEIRDGAKVDRWYDASGHGRHLAQPQDPARPTFHDGAVCFDGVESYLDLAAPGLAFKDVTLFVVAAPFSNTGGFHAILSMNRDGKNDYSSGLNIDMGPALTRRFGAVSIEGAGSPRPVNLMAGARPSGFGVVRRMTITSTAGPGGIRLYLDGEPAGTRDRAENSVLHADRITAGARRYNNAGGPPKPQGFFDGDLLQVLIYDRVLDEGERAQVGAYLAARSGGGKIITRRRPPTAGKPLVAVEDPPPVQWFVPGFSARALPIDLPNINNLKYRHDGKLVALAYNGDIFLLSDSKGTGLEDRVERFWDNQGRLRAPIGMALTPPGYRLGDGVFVASKGKVSLIVDTDHDGTADREIIVAQGWEEVPHGVDALGVAVGADESIYFGLGVTSFGNAYQLDKEGRAHYDLHSERGTILKVAPDFSTREIIATGIRFPVALAFNRLGDLFATDQEGATWLANGNPFDELLQIERGRHYGFPPRHPRHLPSVIDEPSVFDYGPQHQSTCGLNFNEPVNGGSTFGPASWRGDALVTGYSRGKLYRTKLAKTPAGYVAQTQLLACLNMLTADACVSPRGDLLVAVHSGLPDWGSGPSGRGKLYKIAYRDRSVPQPVLTWASGPQEVRVAYDRPLDLSRLRDLARNIRIEYGQSVRPGDRFESIRPGYDVVQRQTVMPRFELPVLSAQVSGDRRTLLLTTAPHPEAAGYAVTLCGPDRPDTPRARTGELPRSADVDLGYDLSGVSAAWQPEAGAGDWSGWLPHLDPAVARTFTAGSADHDRLWEAIERPGRLTLRTRLDLWQMLRPAVQPGSTLDHAWPDETVKLTFASSGPIEVTTPDGSTRGEAGPDGRFLAHVTSTPKAGEPLPITVALATGRSTALEVNYSTDEDARARALPLRRFVLPWAVVSRRSESEETEIVERDIPELKGGDWARGRTLFFGDQARCSSCHAVRGRGGDIGPDLSNLIHRDYASVARDIHSPGAAINPDYIAFNVALRDGRVFQGTLRTEGDRLFVGDTAGRLTGFDRSEVEASAPSAVSIMPEGLDTALGPEKVRDLLTFLLIEPLRPAAVEREGAPPPRPRSEVEAVLKGSTPVPNPRALRIVLVAGPKDHGPGEHDYPLWQERWSALLATAEGVEVQETDGWPTAEQRASADVIVINSSNPGWTEARGVELDRYLARGGGLVVIHYGVNGQKAVEALADRIGLAWRGGKSRFRHGALEVDFSASQHPITRGFKTLRLIDESYWDLIGDPASIDVLGSATEAGAPRPLFWTRTQGKGRTFVSIPGHYTWTFDDPLYRVLLLRGIAWSAGEPIDRFNDLATIGARCAD